MGKFADALERLADQIVEEDRRVSDINDCICAECGAPYALRHGEDPTKYCDRCAQVKVIGLERDLAAAKDAFASETSVLKLSSDLAAARAHRDKLALEAAELRSDASLLQEQIARLENAARVALDEMCRTVAPRTSFTDAVDALDAALENKTNGKP